MNKTCYFCSRKGKKEQECTLAWCDVCEDMHEFTPNADWLYIEQLEKENEELKKYKEETEKWLGSSPYSYVNEDEVNK
jgi:hypothetical protein